MRTFTCFGDRKLRMCCHSRWPTLEVRVAIVNNYSPKWRWLAVEIYRAAKRRGKYQPLATDTEVNSCFSIY